MKLLGISGTILGSKTAAAVDASLDVVRNKYPDIEVDFLDMRHYKNVQFCDGSNISDYNEDTQKVIEMITTADFYIIGTPIFQSSITGVLKNLFDLVPVPKISNKVMGFIATGGTSHHYLVVENQLKPIAGYFRAYVAPGHVYIHDEHFDEQQQIANEDIIARIEKLADEVVFMQNRLKG